MASTALHRSEQGDIEHVHHLKWLHVRVTRRGYGMTGQARGGADCAGVWDWMGGERGGRKWMNEGEEGVDEEGVLEKEGLEGRWRWRGRC